MNESRMNSTNESGWQDGREGNIACLGKENFKERAVRL